MTLPLCATRLCRHLVYTMLPGLALAGMVVADTALSKAGTSRVDKPAPVVPGLPVSALPALPDQSDPWFYRGSDVPHDKEWFFGTLPNGLRWAVRRNNVPPGQVSIRIRMDAGSLNEQPGEEGFAHLIEHLVFRQSKYLGESQAIPAWQRLGASFGTDTNAETTPIHTVFKIDLPNATPASLDESFKLLSGMMIAPTLSESGIRTEVPIVLAEKREHGGGDERVADVMRQVMFAGQPMADHATIGTVESVSHAHEGAVRAFHARWYRPENCAIIVAGDADPRLMAALITKWFGNWPTVGAHTPPPDFGAPVPVPGANPANPVGPVRVLVEPEMPRSITYAIERPWHEKNDTITYNQGLMIDQVAQAIINRRLEARARAGASYLAAQVGQENDDRSVDATFVTITPLNSHWRVALHDVRSVIADALARAPTKQEIAREVAEIAVVFDSQAQQHELQPGGRLADDLVQALDIHETEASPETVRDLFQNSIPLFTPQAVLDHTRSLFTGTAVRAVYVTPDAKDGGDAALKAALLEKITAVSHAPRVDPAPVSFADLPPIGPVAPPPVATRIGLLEIERLEFPNGVHVLLWPTRDDPGRVTVKVRFGAGLRAFSPDEGAIATLGSLALVGSGEGQLGQEELDRVSTGRKLNFDFHTDEGYFTFSADTRAEDLADQLYLFADKFAAPRWDAAPVRRAAALAELQYDALSTSPQNVLNRDLKFLQHARDPRYETSTPAAISKVTPEAFRKVWAPILAEGPIEVEVFGDFARDDAIDALRRTFGALPSRHTQPVIKVSDSPAFATPSPQPVVLRHRGDANQAAAVVSWPTGGGLGGIKVSRQLEVLAQLFQNRLMLAMREKAGASYAPQVGSDWPTELASGGTITAVAQLQPDDVLGFFKTADAIAADLAAKPPSADELALVVEPMRQQVTRAATSTAFFMWQIAGTTEDKGPERIAGVRSILADYTDITPEQIQALAKRYLVPQRAWRLEVLPETQAAASVPPSGTARHG